MKQTFIGAFEEKSFLKEVFSKYARTAALQDFDDCIVIDLEKVLKTSGLPYLVYSIDHPSFIKRPVTEDLKYRFYGRWVAAIVCGDVLAMGARPLGFSLDIAAPLEMEVQNLEYILLGINEVLSIYGATYEGGNFDVNDLETVGMAWGIVAKDKIIRRKGAQVGDFIGVTTTLGHGWADYMSRKLKKTALLSDQTNRTFHEFKMMPVAPHEAILGAVETGGITSGMDLSDGMIELLYTIKERNGLGSIIYEDWISITPEMEEVAKKILQIRPGLFALEPGYDTPLSHGYTISPDKWDIVAKAFEENDSKLYKIGVVQEKPEIMLKTTNDTFKNIPPFWDDQFGKGNTIDRWMKMIQTF